MKPFAVANFSRTEILAAVAHHDNGASGEGKEFDHVQSVCDDRRRRYGGSEPLRSRIGADVSGRGFGSGDADANHCAEGAGDKLAEGNRHGTGATAPAAPAGLVDINSASEADLQTLSGIGPTRAKAIVAGRPYKGKDDLVKKNIIPSNVYQGIKDQIIAKQK